MRALVVPLLAFVLHAAVAAEPRYTFVTFTGLAGGAGADDGSGAAARFWTPIGISTDAAGNVYVADLNNNTVRKLAPDGTTTTVAGLAGSIGNANGAGAAALFNGPAGTAVDSKGNIYVADIGNHWIRKITPAGVVTTFAGGPSSGAADGNGTKAYFNFPADVAVDANDNVYVADGGNNTIRKITPSGDVTTLAGSAPVRGFKDGTGKVAQFSVPQGVACDKDGNVYVADTGNDAIRKITPAGVVTTLAGNGGPGHADGTGSAASFYRPYGVAVGPSGNIYVADDNNNSIRKVTPAGVVTTIAGGGTEVHLGEFVTNSGAVDGTGRDARFFGPDDLAADGSGNIYVADTRNQTIRKIASESVVTTFAGKASPRDYRDGAAGEARFVRIDDMTADSSGNLYVIDDRMVRKISANGAVTTIAGGSIWDALNPYVDGAPAAARFDRPNGLAIDGAGNLYVAEINASTIRKIAANGTVSTLTGTRNRSGHADGTLAQATFTYPADVLVDRNGTIYVAEDCDIRKITTDGLVSRFAGKPGSFSGCGANADGPADTAQLSGPNNMVMDGAGNLYVSTRQSFNGTPFATTIRKITPSGFVTTIAGNNTKDQIYRDGRGMLAGFFDIGGMAIDAAGNLFVTDIAALTVRKVSAADAMVTTIGGFPGELGTAEATGLEARFNHPNAIAVDSAGNLFVAEDHVVRAARPALADTATIDALIAVAGGQRQLGTTPRNGSSYAWSFVRQPSASASAASLSSSSIADPAFTPDVEDLFQLRLTATDSVSTSVTGVTLLAANGTATPAGNGVKIGAASFSVTFPSVTSSGRTVIAALPSSLSDPLPDAKQVPQGVYEATTTAAFTAPARVCATLTSVLDIQRASIYHREGTALADRTTSRDAATKTLCADVASLGRFVVAVPAPKRRAAAQ